MFALSVLSACNPPTGFECSNDMQCRNEDGEQGICSPLGGCGYTDPTCPFGYRYSDAAPSSLAGMCVGPTSETTSGATGDPESTSSSVTTVPTPDSSSSSSTTDASSSGPPLPVCGDGVVDATELCDDGNLVETDGCNPDCRPSLTELWSFTSGITRENDVGRALALLESGDIVVVGYVGPGGSRDAWVARYTQEGAQVWSQRRDGPAGAEDLGLGLAVSAEGNVQVTGVLRSEDEKGVRSQDLWLAEYGAVDGAAHWDFVEGAPAPSDEQGRDIISLPDGELILAERVGPSGNTDFTASRYRVTPSGDGFALDRIWRQQISAVAGASDLALTAVVGLAGRVFVGGSVAATMTDPDRRLEVFESAGVPVDPPCSDVGSNGADDPLAASDLIVDLAIGAGGEVVAVGRAVKSAEQDSDAWIGLYPAGSCELEWATTVVGPGGDFDVANAVAVDDIGRIVVAGSLTVGNGSDAWLAKYDRSGDPVGEAVLVDGPGNGDDTIYDLVIADDREIIVVGQLSIPGDAFDTWFARYTP